jgi:MerR family transcriptional regulator, light-induced transcriptional regulator
MTGFEPYLDRFLHAARRQDAPAMLLQLERAGIERGTGECVDEVLFPALRRIGRWWQSEQCGTDTERLATEVGRTWVAGVAASAPVPLEAPSVVLACGPGDRHTVGLEALAALLRQEQQPCRVLGARVAPRAIVTAVGAGPARAAVVVSHLRAHRLAATQALRSVVPLGADLFYAGAAFSTVRLRRNVPGTFLGTSLQAACATIVGTGTGSTHQ